MGLFFVSCHAYRYYNDAVTIFNVAVESHSTKVVLLTNKIIHFLKFSMLLNHGSICFARNNAKFQLSFEWLKACREDFFIC